MSADAENELTPPADDPAGTEPVSESPPDPAPDRGAPVVEWPGAGAADRSHRVREITRLATERQSPWRGRVIAGAVGAGLTLVGLALRDTLGGRRSPPQPPQTLRRRAASWLRGEDR